MRTRASMGKMVNKLTKRELQESFALIDRIARGASQPYAREFVPHIVAVNDITSRSSTQPVMRENAFQLKERTADNVVVMRSAVQGAASTVQPIIFPDVFYEYFEVINGASSKVG